ncbi:hypothetical protein [Coleofasciculus sp. FACHB-SPT9]|uniref:hypothetical protein n=1 Tax=Coleofasciculus sp. FACHB-SPT9 TaxID=2692791 RepID=UPI00168A08B3|nr:hypothetical protein [Coleofasciculus sp. FACHB-SPT9]MBD1889483.1 hypothetical protein [Coleofasciculus sp. FACHB-SPT9]
MKRARGRNRRRGKARSRAPSGLTTLEFSKEPTSGNLNLVRQIENFKFFKADRCPFLALWENLMNLSGYNLRKIKLSPQFSRRGLDYHL